MAANLLPDPNQLLLPPGTSRALVPYDPNHPNVVATRRPGVTGNPVIKGGPRPIPGGAKIPSPGEIVYKNIYDRNQMGMFERWGYDRGVNIRKNQLTAQAQKKGAGVAGKVAKITPKQALAGIRAGAWQAIRIAGNPYVIAATGAMYAVGKMKESVKPTVWESDVNPYSVW